MSNERVNASVKRDHIHLLNLLFRWDEPTQKFVAQPEVFFNTPGIAVDMGNLVGNLNKSEREQYPDGGPGPTPDPNDPYADLRWRLANVGSLAAFSPVFFDQEGNRLKAEHPELYDDVSRVVGYYGPGGYGNVNVRRKGNAFEYVDLKTGDWTPYVDGNADAMILANANNVPPPTVAIPKP